MGDASGSSANAKGSLAIRTIVRRGGQHRASGSRLCLSEGASMSAQMVRQTGFIRVVIAVVVVTLYIAGRLSGQTASTDWPSYNRTLTSERYAPLDQIDRTNVSNLRQQCVYDLNVDTNFQTGPIVIGRTLYATTDKEL